MNKDYKSAVSIVIVLKLAHRHRVNRKFTYFPPPYIRKSNSASKTCSYFLPLTLMGVFSKDFKSN